MLIHRLLLSVGLLIASASVATAQIMGVNLNRGALQMGYMHKWFHREMEPNMPAEMRWEVGTYFLRYGGFDWLTLSFEGGLLEFENDDFVGLKYRRFAVGAGVVTRFYRYRNWNLSGSFHYNEVWDHDDSPNHFHKRTRGTIAGLQIDRTFGYRGQSLALWMGPAYVVDVGENYPWDSTTPIRNESSSNFGIVGGAELVLFRHLAGIAYVVYADHLQPRLGVAYQVGGDK